MQKPRNSTCSMPRKSEHATENAPAHPEWISEGLLRETQRVWSKEYGRPLSEAEAVDILVNVKNLAEVLLLVKKEAKEK